MKKILLIGLLGFLLAGCGADQGRIPVPHEMGGFVLGDDISNYAHQLSMPSDLPIRYIESIHEVEIKPSRWFKSGLISYGTCAQPGKIIRIKLKYEDDSREFYDELLRRFKQRFGKPDEWRGDPFQVMIAWKWSFVDKDKNTISLTLQHNIRDAEEKIGNAVKMNMTSALEKEKRCFRLKQRKKELPEQSLLIPFEQMDEADWDVLIPH